MIISESDYNEIISEIGFPVLDSEDLEFTETQIQDFFIFPAMREFFIWFPKKSVSSSQVTGAFEIDFPDLFTYGVIDSRLNTTASGSSVTTSPFMNELIFNARTSSSGRYGTVNDYGFAAVKYGERAERRAVNDYAKSYKITINNSEKKVEGFTNITGELIVTWAKYSDNFDDIPFRRKSEVINLAKAKTLKGFAMLRGQMNADIGIEFDVDKFEDRAKDLEEETLKKWKSMTKVVIIRG